MMITDTLSYLLDTLELVQYNIQSLSEAYPERYRADDLDGTLEIIRATIEHATGTHASSLEEFERIQRENFRTRGHN